VLQIHIRHRDWNDEFLGGWLADFFFTYFNFLHIDGCAYA